jgi:hypothetical protein
LSPKSLDANLELSDRDGESDFECDFTSMKCEQISVKIENEIMPTPIKTTDDGMKTFNGKYHPYYI